MAREDHSVLNEPQFRDGGFAADPGDSPLAAAPPEAGDALPVGQSAWDEPALSGELAGERPEGVETYAEWLARGTKRLSLLESWGITFALVLVSGLWSVVGAILNQVKSNNMGGVLLIIAFGPLAEEMLKASSALITIEKWPYAFRSPVQIIVCCAAAGLGFAALENLLYLHVYIDDPSDFMIGWRWTVCVMLHVGCSTIASLGLVKIWRETMTGGTPPRVALGTPYFITAATVHGIYNFFAILVNPLFAKM